MSDSTETLVQLFNTANSGPSAWGLSTHSDWIECGRRASLRAADRAEAAEVDTSEDDPAAGLNGLKIGIYAHKLWEGRVKRLLGDDLVWDARSAVFNVNFIKAIELYRDYHRIWGSVEERFGCMVHGAEMPLGGPVVEAEVLSRLGGPWTGRADVVVTVVDPDKALTNTGLHLMPGRYLYDLKTGKKHGSDDKGLYEDGYQAKGYLWLDCLELGEQSAIGMIHDRVIWGHKETTKAKSYAAYVAYPDIFAEEKLRALVRLSMRSQADPQPNPNACKSQWGGRDCYFKTAGRCPGF